MIRRRWGETFRLIQQTDHARISGRFAAALDTSFGYLSPETIDGIALHDAGWPEHDDAPTLSDAGLPLDVFETPLAVGLPIWQRSAERAGEHHPYSGLLVSVHSLSLLNRAVSHSGEPVSRDDRRMTFEVLCMRTRLAELQAQWREAVGLHTDRPLLHGLSHGWSGPHEDDLRYHFHLLQTLDLLSLCVCCEPLPSEVIEPASAGVGGKPIRLAIKRPADDELRVSPWIFEQDPLTVEIPFRAVPARTYESADALHAEIEQSAMETMPVTLRPA